MALLTEQAEIFSEYALTPREHTRYLPQMMDAVLQQARLNKTSLSHIAFANGPGAFTGVRIAASTAQGLSIGLNCPLVAVSTLAVLAQHAVDTYHQQPVLAAIDARMGEAYVGSYLCDDKTGLVHSLREEQLVKLAELETPEAFFLAGSGFHARREAGFRVPQNKQLDDQLLPHAQALVKLAAAAISKGDIDLTGSAKINYLRNQVAEKSRKKVL